MPEAYGHYIPLFLFYDPVTSNLQIVSTCNEVIYVFKVNIKTLLILCVHGNDVIF